MTWSPPALPASHAAPETPGVRRLRLGWIALAAASATGTAGFSSLVRIDRTAAAIGMFLLLAATVLVGIVYFRGKLRRDDAWADAQVALRRSADRAADARDADG